MAPRLSPNSLIHCAACGEDYSATYKRCPFCGAKNTPPVTPKPKPAPFRPPEADSRSAPDPDDTYVFQGQDVFDEEPEEDDYRPARPKGGKRLAEKPSSNPFASAEINWPRVITFLCGLVIIIAALVIVFTSVYPKLRGPKDPTVTGTDSPSPGVTDPISQPTDPVEPNATDPVEPGVTEPGTDVTEPPAVPNDELLNVSFKGRNDADFTLDANSTHTITFNFDPPGWSGPITWSSSNTAYATVDANGKVTNVNTTSQLRRVIITADVGGVIMESTVYCKGVPAAEPTQPPATQPPATQPPATQTPATQPPATQPPASQPPASDPPATQTPSGGGSVTVGRRGTIVNAELGLRVRSGPGTSYTVLATLRNGSTVNVLEAAEGGWYKITFSGAGGAATEGYILGEYISTD